MSSCRAACRPRLAASTLAITMVVALAVASRADAALSGNLTFASTTNLQPAHEVMVNNFEKANPGVKVSDTYLASAQLQAGLLTQLQSGSAPDILYTTYGGATPIPVFNLARAGRLANLHGAAWSKRNIPGQMKNLVQSGRSLWAPILQLVPSTVVYNADEFRRLKLKVPRTFAQFLQLCRDVDRRTDLTPLAHAGGQVTGNIQLMLGITANEVYGPRPGWNILRAKNKVRFSTDRGWKNALQRVVEMKNAKCFAEGVAGTTNATVPHSQVATGRALMAVSSAGPTVAQSVNPKVRYGVLQIPARTASRTYLNVSPNSTIAVNAKGNVALAKAFVEFAMQPAQQRARARAGFGIAPIDYIQGRTPSHLRSLAVFFKKKRTVIDSYIQLGGWPKPAMFTALGGGLTGLFNGQLSAADILQRMDTAW